MTPQESFEQWRGDQKEQQTRDQISALDSEIHGLLKERVLLIVLSLFICGIAIYSTIRFEAQKAAATGWKSNYIAATNINNALMKSLEREKARK